MAGEGDIGNDIPAHQQSYSLFAALMKWGTIISFGIAALVVLLLAM